MSPENSMVIPGIRQSSALPWTVEPDLLVSHAKAGVTKSEM
jgi:hypothetical protein